MDSTASFCEALGKTPFDWNKFLERAIKKEITLPEYEEACRLSGSWVTCAVGNQCAIIPRQYGNQPPAPKDIDLRRLGADFHCHIVAKEFETAITCLHRIEIRSAQIINQIRSTNGNL